MCMHLIQNFKTNWTKIGRIKGTNKKISQSQLDILEHMSAIHRISRQKHQERNKTLSTTLQQPCPTLYISIFIYNI